MLSRTQQSCGGKSNLEGRHHLTLLLTVSEVVVVLHRDEGGEVVCDGIVCNFRVNTPISYEYGEIKMTYFEVVGLKDGENHDQNLVGETS